jgi:predicted TIM-barrel fold metal-dependent hydrolase
MSSAIAQAVDADGHIMESLAEMAEYAHPSVKELCLKPQNFFRTPFPTLDGVHWPNPETYREEFGIMGDQQGASEHRKGSGEDWLEFLDKADVEYSVMYTSEGLTVGALRSVGYTIAVCQAYNDYVGDRYRALSDKLLPMALIPMQSPKDAAIELRRVVNDLKLPGAMLPSSGLPLPLGHEYYWPVYEEAARLGCVLGVHGGPNGGMGLDAYDSLAASHVIHHPMGLMIACSSMIHSGIFERHPDLKVAYTEGGSSWCTIFLDRMARNAELEADLLGHTKTFEQYLTGGQILIGCEGEEPTLEHLIQRVGIDAFAFSTDYPHEVDFAAVRKQIKETKELTFMNDQQKSAFLGDNARRFFNLG